MLRLLFAIGIVMGAFLFFPNSGLALTFSPTRIEQEIAAGTSVTAKVRIYNETNVSVFVSSEIAALAPKGEEGEVEVTPATPNANTLTSWIDAGASFTLDPQKWVDTLLEIRVPSDAEPGTYAAAVLFRSSPQNQGGGAVGIITKTGPVVIVTVPGEVRKEFTFLDFSILDKPFASSLVFDKSPAQFQIRIQNTGTVSFVPAGSIVVTDLFGHAVSRLVINESNRLVLPQWRRSFSMIERTRTSQNGLLSEWQPFALGRYTAETTLSINGQTTIKTITFWVFPWRTGSIVVVLAVLGVLGRMMWRGRR